MGVNTETVLEVQHYNNNLFSFKTTRNQTFKFKTGEFAMIGLHQPKYDKDIFRAYSICSTPYDDHLEFLSIKIPDGPLTSVLSLIQPGDKILVKPKTTGSLCVDYLTPKQNLVMLATGTGLAPFLSVVRDPFTYERFENVYLFHTTRTIAELAYREDLLSLSEQLPLKYVDSVTREVYNRNSRFWDYIPEYLEGGFNKDRDGILVCGSPSLNKQCRTQFAELGLEEGNTGEMGDFLLERAFVD